MMKHLKVTLLSAVMASAYLLSGNVNADPVSLNITGNVVASPCQISSDSVTKSVDLGQNIQASTLKTAGATSDWVNFDINLDSCPAGTTKAIMTMHGSADTDNPGNMYKNTGTATDIAVVLESQAGDQLGDGKSITGTIANEACKYQLRARVYTKNGNATPGTIASVVTATFTYQ